MCADKDWQGVGAAQPAERLEQSRELRRRVDVLLSVSADKEELAGLQLQPIEHAPGVNSGHDIREDFTHWAPGLDHELRRQAFRQQVAPCVLRVDHVHVAEVIDHLPIQLFRHTLIKAAIAGFHVKDGNLAALGRDDGEARVGVAVKKHRVRLLLRQDGV